MEKKKFDNYIITGFDGGSFFSVAVLFNLLLTLVFAVVLQLTGATDNERFMSSYTYTFMGFLVSPVAIGGCMLYAKLKGKLNLRMSVGFCKFDIKYLGIALLLFVGCVLGLSGLNTVFVDWLNKLMGYEAQPINLPGSGFGNFLLCTLIVCVIPAIMEESLFRGVVLNGAKRLGDVFAVLVCGGLFCLYHHSPQQTVYQFILGALFALLAVKSGSIYPSVIFHFLNNFYIIVGYFIWGESLSLPTVWNVIIVIVGLVVLALGIFLLIKAKKCEREEKIKADFLKVAELKQERKAFLISSLTGTVVCAILWLVELFS